MMRRATGFSLLLGFSISCGDPTATTLTSGAVSSPSGAVATASGSASPQADLAFVERARAVATSCNWSDDQGFEDCKALDAVLAAKLSPPQAFAAAELLLADPKPAVRRVGLSLLNQTVAPSPSPAPPLGTALVLIKAAESETVPALDLRLAMAAASLPKSDDLQKPLEALLRNASVPKRATALVFFSKGDGDPPWVRSILLEAGKDKEPEIRLAATRGLFGRFLSQRGETCKLLVEALQDPEVRVRDAARSGLVGSIDVMLEDDKRGLIGGRAAPFSKSCDEDEVVAAYKSLEKDVRDKKVSTDARALFHNGALLRGPWNTREPITEKAKQRRDFAVKELTAIAKDKKAPRSARLTAIRGLRLKIAGDTKATLAALSKDADDVVAKAAAGPEE